jgi:hypothetical protein
VPVITLARSLVTLASVLVALAGKIEDDLLQRLRNRNRNIHLDAIPPTNSIAHSAIENKIKR